MKKNLGLFNVFLFFMIVTAIFFILHFGGVILLRSFIGWKYSRDGEISKSEAILIAREYGNVRNFLQLWRRYHINCNIYTWKDIVREEDVWILTTDGSVRSLGGQREYVIIIHAETGVILESRFTGKVWYIQIH